MRVLLIAVSILICSVLAQPQKSIRQVDFKNFTYPLTGPLLGHDRLQWLPIEVRSPGRPIQLKHGQDIQKVTSVVVEGHEYPIWQGFTLTSAKFAKITGEGQEQAIIVLHYKTGGTQQTDYVYIYSLAAGKPDLLGYFHTGDRAYSGLRRVFADRGNLVVELFDPDKRSGDCCSSGIVRTRFKWQNGKFEAVPPAERETLEEH